MLATVLTSTLGGAKPEAVFLKARQALVADSSPLGGLTAAITALKSAQEACSVDKEADAPLRRVLNQTLSGYERRHELATFVPQPKPKLLKAQKTAQRKLKSMREDMEGDELQSKEDKKELAKLEAAERVAAEAIEFAAAVERVKEGRALTEKSYSPRKLLERHKAGQLKGELKVLSESPLILTLDNWLGPEATKALDDLPQVLDNTFGGRSLPSAPPDWKAEEDGEWQPDAKAAGQLCLAKDEAGAPQPRLGKAIDKAIAEAQAAAKKNKPHCAATASLKGATEYILPSLDGKSENCGPLTQGLEAALTHSDAAWMLINANRTVDTLDVALAFANGFGAADVEAAFASALDLAMSDHDDPATLTAPDGWDSDEDGEWQPDKVPAQSYMAAMAKALQAEHDASVQDGLGAAYAVSSSPELLRYRASTMGGATLHLECDDFANERPAATAAVAYLYASDVKKGGEDTFPALGLSVAPKKGRLLLFETMMSDGTCDAATATASLPLKGDKDKLLLAKRFYSDTSHDRGAKNSEQPDQPPPKMVCDDSEPFGCRRYAAAGTPEGGDAVMAARAFKDRLM
jgi:hypothetical protein